MRTKYNPTVVKEILKYLEQGATQKDAMILVGVSEPTFYNWLDAHPEFFKSVGIAMRKCKQRNAQVIQRAAINGDWRAAAWWSERKYADEFALKSIHELQGKGGGPIHILEDNMTEEDRARYRKEIDGVVLPVIVGQEADHNGNGNGNGTSNGNGANGSQNGHK